jgi:hypothetical protein
MKKYFPSKQVGYLQTNRSKFLGSLWSSFNLDFQTDLGVMKIAQKLVTNTTSSDDADLGRPGAFEYFDDRWWAICGTRVFKNTSYEITSSFTEDASTGAITTYTSDRSDLAVFDDRLWSSATGKLLSKTSNGSGTGSWTDRTSTATLSGNVFQLAYFKKFDRLYFINTIKKVASINTSNVVAVSSDYSIDIGTSIGRITSLKANSSFVWIGTMRVSDQSSATGTQGSILQWDGISAQATNEYTITTAGVLALLVHEDIPYAVDSEGRILKYNGTAFAEIARLPINVTLLTGATYSSVSNGRFVHFNGFQATKNNTLLVSVNNLNDDAGDTVNENLSSGIWELDLNTLNFTHRYTPTLKALSSSTVTDYGQNKVLGVGAIKVNTLTSDSSNGQSTLLAGFAYYTDATTTKSGIFIDSPANPNTDNEGQKKGYFVTTWFTSDEVASSWDDIWSTFRQFQTSTDSVV